jgi:hypothetical protein
MKLGSLISNKIRIEPPFLGGSRVSTWASNQWLAKVRPFLCLGVLAVQIAMILNNVYGLPLRQIF